MKNLDTGFVVRCNMKEKKEFKEVAEQKKEQMSKLIRGGINDYIQGNLKTK